MKAEADKAVAAAASGAVFTVTATQRLTDVETIWRALEAEGVESPGQSYDFIRLWVRERAIPQHDQLYLVGVLDGVPLALMALQRRRRFGVTVMTWFPGAHVGCLAPLVDRRRLAALGPEARRALWTAMMAQVSDADAVYLRAVPQESEGFSGLFDELGSAVAVDTLYRARFSSWEECDRLQRSRTRRKHDRQQGERFAAMGEVAFAEMRNGEDIGEAIATMFRHRSARFKQMGIRDTFALGNISAFYRAALAGDSEVDVRLHVLRLNGEIVATRYNVVHGARMFCLISSMSDDPDIQAGSPGKQCLLRVMQSVFDAGTRVFDMGAGLTDEKRHWCNEQIVLRQHYIPLTWRGHLAAAAHQRFQAARARVKADRRFLTLRRTLGKVLNRKSWQG
jgi:CelD/BcsL family acetyltransferase involved in cellulose biosynthesis